ncbi:MAG: Maf family nucleotide pyrophosphatase [Agarilytica sp.]
MELQLASKSPRRRELLDQIGVRYKVVSVDVPEQREPSESPLAYVTRLALSKSEAGAQAFPGLPTLGSDTIVVCDGKVLEKPADFDDFRRMMRLLSASSHSVITAVAVCVTDEQGCLLSEQTCADYSATDVCFRSLSDIEIEQYWQTGEPQDKAGGYAIQGLGATFVREIHGSYSGVVGLPIETLVPLLDDHGVKVWNTGI